MRCISFVTKTSSESKTGSRSESRDPLMGRIVHCQGKGGNGGVSEGEWRDARLDEDLDETKLVGCGEKSRDWSVPGE